LTAAQELLTKTTSAVDQRRTTYGPPAEHFARTAAMISVLFANKFKDNECLTGEEWAMCMVCDKLCRHAGPSPIEDNIVDTAGYAACWYEAWRERETAK